MGFLLVLSLLAFGVTMPSHGQIQTSSRIGGGVHFQGSTALGSAGPGVHLRMSFPMNYELSFAVGTTFTGFVLQGSAESAYSLDTEASLIVTLPNPSRSSTYLLGGVGYHAPIGGGTRYEGVVGGPTFHGGIGKVWQLDQTSVYVEVAPTMFFRRDRTDVLLPLRGGIIF